uniref:Uncharacterized protein n=1 Tax=Timema poppense TaxID=170557 RepID=A0A7R9CHZ1_TIMPO|nr:unnamed protein product [Timema poppensis]
MQNDTYLDQDGMGQFHIQNWPIPFELSCIIRIGGYADWFADDENIEDRNPARFTTGLGHECAHRRGVGFRSAKMSSPVDFDEFDLEIQAFGEYLDDISRKINARNYTETLADPEDEGSSEEAFETPVVNIPPISVQLDDCAINGDINKPVEVAVDVIPKDADRGMFGMTDSETHACSLSLASE